MFAGGVTTDRLRTTALEFVFAEQENRFPCWAHVRPRYFVWLMNP